MEFLQNYRSIRNSEGRHNDSKESPIHRADWSWTVARIWLFLIVAFLPWKNGSVQWHSQYLLLHCTWPLVLYVLILTFTSKSPIVKMPGISIILGLLALFAILQSSVRYPLAPGGWTPNVVRIQQWTLGQDVELSSTWFTPWMKQSIEGSRDIVPPVSVLDNPSWISSAGQDLIDQNTSVGPALSLDPHWTRSAAVSLLLAACFLWLGSQLLCDPRHYRHYLIVLVLLGLTVAAHYFIQTVSWNPPSWLRITDKSVGPFHNKNIGGAFLSLCFGASIGFSFLAFMGNSSAKRRIDKRYKIATTNQFQKLMQQVIDGIGELKTFQIVCLISTAVIFGAIIASLSRGALLSASFAAIATLLLTLRRRKSILPLAISISIAIIAIGIVQGLDLEGDVVDRLESVGDEVDESKSQRLIVWKAVLKATSFYLWTGSGLGTFRFAAIPFIESKTNLWFGYAESLVGHLLVEFGILGFLAATVGVGELLRLILLYRQKSSTNSHGLFAYSASAFACIYLLSHNLFDFGLIVPAVYVPASILVGSFYCTTIPGRNSHQMSRHKSKSTKVNRPHRNNPTSPIGENVDWNDGDSKISEMSNGSVVFEGQQNLETLDAEQLRSPTTPNRRKKQSRRRGVLRDTSTHENAGVPSPRTTFWNRIQFSPITLAVGAIVASCGIWLTSPSLKLSAEHERWAKTLEDHLKASEFDVASELPFPSVHSLKSAEGLRILGTQKLLIWRLRRNELDGKPDVSSPEWKMTSPILARLTATDLTRKNRNLRELFGGDEQIKLWNESRLCFQFGHRLSPMDWRLMWGRMLLDWTTPETWQRKYLYRCAAMAQQRVPELFEISMLAEELAESSLADECYRSLVRRRPPLNKTIAAVLSEKRSDQSIDPSIFSNRSEILEEIAEVYFSASKFPQTNARLWQRIEEVAQGIPRSDPKRTAWLSKVARSRGDIEQEIIYLEASLRIDPKSDRLWKRYVEAMAQLGKQTKALEFIKESESTGGTRPEFAGLRKTLTKDN